MLKINRKIFAFLILSLSLCAVIPAAHAVKISKDFKKEMPNIKLIPQEEFETQTILHESKPFDNEALAYSIRVPKDWEEKQSEDLTEATITNKIYTELAMFYGPSSNGLRSTLSIKAIRLEYNLSAEQWFIQFLLKRGITPEGMNVIDEKTAEGIYVTVEEADSFFIYTKIAINGPYAVITDYVMPIPGAKGERPVQVQVVQSFKLRNNVEGYAEKMEEYRFLDIMNFKYPVSWELRSEPMRTIDLIELELLNIQSRIVNTKIIKRQEFLEGKMDVKVVSYDIADTLENEEKEFLKRFLERDLILGDVLEQKKDIKGDEYVESSVIKVYKLTDSNHPNLQFELWVAVIDAFDYYIMASVYTPSRDEDYPMWARNTQTFRVILDNMQVNAESFYE